MIVATCIMDFHSCPTSAGVSDESIWAQQALHNKFAHNSELQWVPTMCIRRWGSQIYRMRRRGEREDKFITLRRQYWLKDQERGKTGSRKGKHETSEDIRRQQTSLRRLPQRCLRSGASGHELASWRRRPQRDNQQRSTSCTMKKHPI